MTELNALGLAHAGLVPLVDLTYLADTDQEVYQDHLGRLDIFSESLVLTRFVDGKGVTYEVSPLAVAEVFSDISLSSGLLPRHTLFYGLAEGQPYLGVYLPPQQRKLSVHTTTGIETLTLPLPGLVFTGRGKVYHVFAVKRQPDEPQEMLYHAPLPNVSAGGQICQGNVAFPVCTPETIRQAVEAFLNSNFNNHLPDNKSQQYKNNILEMWQTLAASKAKRYPLDDLMQSGLRLKDIVGGPR